MTRTAIALAAALLLGAGAGHLLQPRPPVVHVVVDQPVVDEPSDLERLLVCPLDLCPMDTP